MSARRETRGQVERMLLRLGAPRFPHIDRLTVAQLRAFDKALDRAWNGGRAEAFTETDPELIPDTADG